MPTFDLDAICNPPPTELHRYEPQPIYRFDDYIALYERVCKQQGFEFDASRFDPKVYKYEPPAPTVEREKFDYGEFGDRVRVRLDVDENTERVTIAVDTVLNDLFSKYWAKGEQPPLNELVVTFKKLGADDAFLKKIIKRHDRIRSVCKKFDLDRAFKPKAKPKKKKQKEEDVEEEMVDDDEPREEEEEEFEGMDVEENEDDDECQGGDDDEEYIDMED
jgi:hypothetical protein